MRRHSALAPIVVAAVSAALVLSMSGFQVTGSVASQRLLGRLAAAVIELDRWLPAHRQDIEASARERPRVSIAVAALPIPVSVPSPAALDAPRSDLRAAIISSMGEALYREGQAAVEGGGSISFNQPARWTVALLRPNIHEAFQYLSLLLLTVLVIAGSIAAITREASPVAAISKPIAVGSGLATIAGALSWLAFRGLERIAGATVNGEVVLMGRDSAALFLRDGMAVFLGASAVLMLVKIASREGRGLPRQVESNEMA